MAHTSRINANVANIKKYSINKRKKEKEELLDYMNNKESKMYTDDIERRKMQIQKEINAKVIKSEDRISWKKTTEEIKKLKIAKAKHNAFCRSHGVNPKMQVNVTVNDVVKTF